MREDNFESLEKGLDEAAEEYAWKELPDESSSGEFGTGDYFPPVDMEYPREIAIDAFKEGAKWQKEQMMKKAVEAEVYHYTGQGIERTSFLVDIPTENFKQEARIIIVDEEEDK